MFSFLKPLIFGLDPEAAHDLAIKSLKLNIVPENIFKVENEEMLETNFLKKQIKNPIGMAAGFDKSAEVYNSLFKLGFSFVEVGTVTPIKQTGNPKPRIFRLEEDEALINRLGFNNDGLDTILKRLESGQLGKGDNILGVNIGPNFNSKSFESDFCKSAESLMKLSLADYITINISSPNTENLRDFHDESKLDSLLEAINKLRKEFGSLMPIFVKVSPDIKDSSVEKISEIIINQKAQGAILTNTTSINRSSLKSSNKDQTGGLSGKPIRDLSNEMIKKFYKKLKGKAFIIGVGGVDSGRSAFEKITAGANAVQLYTGMIYKGPTIVKEIKKDLIEILKNEKIKNISEAVGLRSKH